MKILHKYLLKEVGSIFFLTLFFLTFLFMIRYLFIVLSYMSEFAIPFYLIQDYFACTLPEILFITFPIAALIATMVGLGRLSSDKEIMALSASGVNLASFVLPLIIISFLLSAGIFLFTQIFMPEVRLHETAVNQLFVYKSVESIPVRRVWPIGNDFVVYIGREDKDTGFYEKISILKNIPEEEETLFIIAEKGLIEPDFHSFMLKIRLFNGSIHQNDHERLMRYQYGSFDELEMNVSFSLHRMEEGVYEKRLSEKTNKEIRYYIEMYRSMLIEKMVKSDLLSEELLSTHWLTQSRWLEKNKPEWWNQQASYFYQRQNNHILELAKRYYRSFSTFIFCFIAAGLGIQLHPRSRSWGFIFSMVLFFLYYFSREIAEAIIITGTRFPFLVSWIPNIIFLIIGSYFLFRLSRR